MSYNPTPVVLGAVTLPNNGQPVTAESVNVPLAAIADGVKAVGLNHISKDDFYPACDESFSAYGSTVTSTTYSAVETVVALSTAVLNDRLVFWLTVSADVYLSTGGAGGLLKLVLGSGASRWDMDQAVAIVDTSSRQVHIMATLDLDNSAHFFATPTVYLHGKVAVDGTLRVNHPLGMRYQLLRAV